MRILAISDTHNKHLQIPSRFIENSDNSVDTIVHAGDVSSRGYKGEIIDFLKWYNELNFKNKILIAGNHDFYFEEGKPEDIAAMLAEYPNITYLNDSGVEIDGVKFWGSPVQPWFYNWAFNRKGTDICKHWDMIPNDTHVLLTHGGPKNIGSLNVTSRNKEDVGCPYLYEKLSELKNLKLFVQGHIHEAYGRMDFPDGGIFVNASVLNLRYEMVNLPIQVEITV
jgi:Icc-related predicted phosphoesterase